MKASYFQQKSKIRKLKNKHDHDQTKTNEMKAKYNIRLS